MRFWPVLLLALTTVWAAELMEIRGEVTGAKTPVMVELFGVESSYAAHVTTGPDGKFRFRSIAPGSYTVLAFVPGRTETTRTVVASEQLAKKGVISVNIPLVSGPTPDSATRSNTVSLGQLAVPARAEQLYQQAEAELGKHHAEEASQDLQQAVIIAPQFALAWNTLGVLAYQAQNYPRAESDFRKALTADPGRYDATVNLGGVLLNLNHPQEALDYNKYAVLARPEDALANAQLGMNYFDLHSLDLAEQYLKTAKRIDPSHFSHPQLFLAQIYASRSDYTAAAAELEDFLTRVPDSPKASDIREEIRRLEAAAASK